MNSVTKSLKNKDRENPWDSPLVWSTVAIYSVATVVYLWGDLVHVFTGA
jgi:hypothetical protein